MKIDELTEYWVEIIETQMKSAGLTLIEKAAFLNMFYDGSDPDVPKLAIDIVRSNLGKQQDTQAAPEAASE